MLQKIERALSAHKGLLGLAAIAAGLLLYPLHEGVAYAFALVLLCCCGLLALPQLCALYALLFCFDPVLLFAPLGGSVVRVMQGGLVLRLLWQCYRTKTWPRPGTWVAWVLCIVSFVLGFLRYGIEGDALSFVVNITLFLLMRHVLSFHPETLPQTLQTILRGFAAGVVLALCWGLLYGRFLRIPYGGVVLLRFEGTYEPNFMAMFANVALAGMLCLPYHGKVKDTLLIGLLVATLLLTYSVTGYLFAALLWVLLLIRKRARGVTLFRMLRGMACGLLLFAGVTLVLGMDFVQHGTAAAQSKPQSAEQEAQDPELSKDPNDLILLPEEYETAREAGVSPEPYRRPRSVKTPVQLLRAQMKKELSGDGNAITARINDALWCIRTGNLDLLTSGRLGLYREKWRDFLALPLLNQMLGAGPGTQLTYMPLSYTVTYSHNSYLDLLYAFGFVGTAIILVYVVYTLKKRRIMGIPVRGEVARAWQFCRIAVLLHMLGLSMLLNRVVLFFFM